MTESRSKRRFSEAAGSLTIKFAAGISGGREQAFASDLSVRRWEDAYQHGEMGPPMKSAKQWRPVPAASLPDVARLAPENRRDKI